jgi:molybdopterin-synthase adenylyltransferase
MSPGEPDGTGADSHADRMTQPRVKPGLRPLRVAAGKIQIGRALAGTAELDDPLGVVWTLLEAMTGTRTVDEIVMRVTGLHPGQCPAGVRSTIGELIAAGYIEDLGAEPKELSDRDIERYDRSQGYFSMLDRVPRSGPWETQALLRQARVTVLGIGGVGCHAAMALAVSGVGSLHVIDAGTVELSDLNRQPLFAEADLGRSKAAAAMERLRQLNSDIEVTGKQAEISGVADLEPVAGECDVLVLCARQPREITAWANLACLRTSTPWVNPAYAGPGILVGAFTPGQGGCWQCQHAANDSRCFEDPAAGGPVIAPTAGIAGYLAASVTLGLLTGSPHLAPGRVDAVSLLFPDTSFSAEVPRRPDCPACGRAPAG